MGSQLCAVSTPRPLHVIGLPSSPYDYRAWSPHNNQQHHSTHSCQRKHARDVPSSQTLTLTSISQLPAPHSQPAHLACSHRLATLHAFLLHKPTQRRGDRTFQSSAAPHARFRHVRAALRGAGGSTMTRGARCVPCCYSKVPTLRCCLRTGVAGSEETVPTVH